MHCYKTIIDDIALQAFYQKPLKIQHIDKSISNCRTHFDELLSLDSHVEYDAIRFHKAGINDKKMNLWSQFDTEFNKLRLEIMKLEISSGRPYCDAKSPNIIMFNNSIAGFYSVDLNNCDSVYTRKLAEAKGSSNHAKIACHDCGTEFSLNDLTPFSFSSCAKCGTYTPFFGETISRERDVIHNKLREKERFAGSNLRYMRENTPFIYLVSERVGAIPSFMLELDQEPKHRRRYNP